MDMKRIFIGSYLLIAAASIHAQQFEQFIKLLATDRLPNNNLGTAVAINNNYAVVAGSEIPSYGAASNCNCVYVFEKTSTGDWKQVQKLISPDAASNRFGFSVAINGNYIIVGAPGDENSAGAAYAFLRNASGNWIMEKKLVPSAGSPGDFFGTSVSITSVYGRGDWSYVVIGAPGDADFAAGWPLLPNAGSAYFFSNLLGYWAVINKMYPIVNTYFDRHAGAAFGTSVSISGTTVVVGAPGEKEDTTGSNPMDAAGAAYVFERNGSGAMELVHKIVNWDRAAGDQFGYAVALDRNTLVVGAPFEDEDARMENTQINAGSVYVFRKGTDGRLYWDRKLCASDRATGDNFGTSVSVNGVSNMVVVGSVGDDENANNKTTLNMAGSAYIFRLFEDPQASVWKQLQKVVPFDRAEVDWFGYAVGIDSTSTNIIVTAPFQDKAVNGLNVSDAGAMYVFTQIPCTATTSSISPTSCRTYTSPSKKYTWNRSGIYKDTILNKAECDSVITINLTISNSVDTSVVKKRNALTANAKDATYEWINCETNTPINVTTRTLIATVSGKYKVNIDQNGCIGTSSCHEVVLIAQPADTTRVTNPPVVLPRNKANQKAYIEVNKIVANDRTHNDEFGRSVSISGNYAVIGVPLEQEDVNGQKPLNGAGAAYIFKLDADGKWKQVQKIVANDRGEGDNFGCSVGISGGYIVVGARYDGEGVNGSPVAYLAGSAYIFELDQKGNWRQTQKIIDSPLFRGGQEYFGTAVAIEGKTVVVGTPDHARDTTYSDASNITAAGALFVFERTDSSGWVLTQKLIAKDRALGGWLGTSVSICGNNIIAGAAGGDYDQAGANRMDDAGNAYIFERSGGRWKQTQKLAADDRTPGDLFGFSVAISGDYAVVGAKDVTEKRGDEDNGLHTGNAYIFKRNGMGGWSQQMKINPDDRTQGDYLGTSVGISGDYLIVSAPGQDTDSLGNYMPDAGAIYVYYLNKQGNWVLSDKISTFLKHNLDGFGHAVAISDCNIIGTSWVDQTDEKDENPITNAGAASIFTAAGCNNDGRCSGRLFPWEKIPIDKTKTIKSESNSFPKKVQSADLKGQGNETEIQNINLGNEGIIQPVNIKTPILKTDNVKSQTNSAKIQLCIDKILTGTLPPQPPDEVYRYVPKILPDGTVEEIPGTIKQGLSMLTEKMWTPGQELTVGFYADQTTNFVINKVKQYAVVWENIANIRFRFLNTTSATGATIRIGFDTTDGSWSQLGRNALLMESNKKTMNFGWFNDSTDEDEFRRVILHEFGHALGFIHEHQAPTGGIQWDKEKVYNYYGSSPINWSRSQVDEQIFAKYNMTETNSSIYDSRSIMHYYFPPQLTKNNFSFTRNTSLSKMDTDFVKLVYPLPFEPGDTKGMLLTGDDCDEIVFSVDYKATGVASHEVDFILEPGIDHHGNWITWWKKIGIPLKGGGEAGMEIENKSVSNRKFAVSTLDNTRPLTFWKAKFLGVHTLLDKKWYVMPALVGGCRIRLTWRRDTCL
jgi:hypothetical protein